MRRLLIMGGGLGLLPKRDSFYEALNALPDVRTTLITGGNQKLYDKLHGKYENIEVVGVYRPGIRLYGPRLFNALQAGRITLFETIFSELPILAWEPFLQQERNNARFNSPAIRSAVLPPKSRKPVWRPYGAASLRRQALRRMGQNMRLLKGRLEAQSLARIVATLAAQGRGVCA